MKIKTIAVYGLGKLGYPLLNVLARSGFRAIGIDPLLKESVSMQPVSEPDIVWPDDVTITLSREPQPSDMSFVVVPTPSLDRGDRRGGFDSRKVQAALRHIFRQNGSDHIAVIISTLSPGTCDEITQMPYIRGLNVVYNPTFIALGSVVFDLTHPEMLLLGGPDEDVLEKVYRVWDRVFLNFHHTPWAQQVYVHTASYTEIELIKLSVNCFLGTKISLANSLGQLFEAYGVDPKAVNVVGRDSRVGTSYFMPGSPIAGPCLPRDNRALQQAAAKKYIHLPLSSATDRVNHELIETFYAKICGRMNDHAGHRPHSVGILGMSYKYGLDITIGSTGERLGKRLEASGIKHVDYDDVLSKDTLEEALACDVVVVTQKEYESLVTRHEGRVVRIWP